MNDHYFVVLNRSRLRIYQEHAEPGYPSGCVLVHSVDFPEAHRSYADNASDMAGRFPESRGTGMSIDERLPALEETSRRAINAVARALESFLEQHLQARWEFAAGPALHNAVLNQLSPKVKRGLDCAVQKDLTKIPANELRSHFPVASAR